MATTTSRALTDAHRLYVKSLYRRYLTNSLNWAVHRDVWREQAVEIRAEFDRHKNESDPKAVSKILADTEAKLAAKLHPDPYISAKFPGGTSWERNLPPPPNAFVKVQTDDHHHDHEDHHHHHHHHGEAIEEIDILTPEDRARLGPNHRLSPQASAALNELLHNALGAKAALNIVDGKMSWDQAVKDTIAMTGQPKAKEQELMFSDRTRFSNLTPEQKERVKRNYETAYLDSLEFQARGIIEQEYSDKRDLEDGVTNR